jgi:hypothetical protein
VARVNLSADRPGAGQRPVPGAHAVRVAPALHRAGPRGGRGAPTGHRAPPPAGGKTRPGHAAARGNPGARQLKMRTATPAITLHLPAACAAGLSAGQNPLQRCCGAESSPLLASKTPVWRSKFIVAMMALGLRAWLPARFMCRSLTTISFSARARCALRARWSCLPTGGASGPQWPDPGVQRAGGQHLGDSRGRGQGRPSPGQAQGAGRLLEHALADLQKRKLADEDKTFVWLKRQLDWDVGQQIAALQHQGHLPAQGIQAPVPRR